MKTMAMTGVAPRHNVSTRRHLKPYLSSNQSYAEVFTKVGLGTTNSSINKSPRNDNISGVIGEEH
jgi:hypothetical protein